MAPGLFEEPYDGTSSRTTEFTSTGESVWKRPYIKHALLQSSHSECAYCEANTAEESKYMEVEHFHCKKHFPHLFV